MKRTRLAPFPSKNLNITLINSFLQNLSAWVTAKSNICTRIDFLLLTSVTFLRAITMCGALTADCGYDNSTIFFIVDVYCPETKCLGKLCLHKKTSQSLGRNDYQCPQCASVCQVRNIHFEEQTNSFFLSFGLGVYIFEENPKSIQDVNVFLSWRVLFQQRERRISWWLCNNSEIHLWLWKKWSFVVCSQSSF